MLKRIIRSAVPPHIRARLRSSSLLRKMLAWCYRGVRSRPFPNSAYRFYFDGYRNIGFASRDLTAIEREERACVEALFKQRRPSAVWDIGANVGFWSLFLTRFCRPSTPIWCFEPDPINLIYLRMNEERNGIHNWTIRPVALSDSETTATFYTDPVTSQAGSLEKGQNFIGRHYGAATEEIAVKLSTIDSEIAHGAPVPQFIKIDVEGHELSVLQGGRRTLKTHRPVLLFEARVRRAEVAKLLAELGYDMFGLAGQRIQMPDYYTVALPRSNETRF
jgi:FkbM family methyltransferase